MLAVPGLVAVGGRGKKKEGDKGGETGGSGEAWTRSTSTGTA
jgi:hypothetical protein